jgi:hypothetical protein
VNLVFKAIGPNGSVSPLVIRGFRINDGSTDAYGRNGELRIITAVNGPRMQHMW